MASTTQTRGFRNNNPLNLTLTSIKWIGKIPNEQNTDGRFEQFNSMVDGLRAGMLDVINDINIRGLNTLSKLMYAFAPPHENNTENYISILSKALGIGKNEVIPLTYSNFITLIKTIVKVENGTLPNQMYVDAFNRLPQTQISWIDFSKQKNNGVLWIAGLAILGTGLYLISNDGRTTKTTN